MEQSLQGVGVWSGADSRNRTHDLLITNQLLYQLSYAGTGEIIADASRAPPCAVRALE